MQIPLEDVPRKRTSAETASIASTAPSDHDEPPKVVITRSIPAALRSCAVHLIPIAVSSTVIAFNTNGAYLGADLMSPFKSETINLMLFQLAAKAHEIAIVASLSVIVLHCLRHELLFGEGLPLGLLGSGLAFNHLEYFFSKEFYGSLKYVHEAGKTRKLALVLLIMVAGMVATLAGPASATLLVPKSQDWSAGGTQFYLNGTNNQFWPADLSGDLPELQDICTEESSTNLGICPAAGYESLRTHWGTMNSSTFQTQDVRSYAKEVSGSKFYWPVSSPSSLIPPLYALGDIQQAPNGRTSLTQPHAATTVILQRLAKDWWSALQDQKGLTNNQVDDRTASATFKNAITVARCSEPQEIRASDTTVKFPSIHGRFDFADALSLNVPGVNKTRTDHLRFQWVHLPAKFGAASIGALFETPWSSRWTDEPSRAVLGCTIQAGWVPATVYTDKYIFWTGWYTWNILFGDRTPVYNPASIAPTNGRVAFGDKWLSLLTPPAPIIASKTTSWHPSTIESILHTAGATTPPETWLARDTASWERVSLVEAIICSVILDGLSRTGSHRVFNISSAPPEWSIANYNPLPDFNALILDNKPALQPPSPTANADEYIAIDARMQISGFSLQASLATYLSMTVLLIHMVMAALHTFYIVIQRHTSGSWSTVGELIALAQNSQPALNALPNTGGGIKRSRTYAQVARIRVVSPRSPESTSSSDSEKRIELLFGDSLPCKDARSRVEHPNGSKLRRLRDSRFLHPATWPRPDTHSCIRGPGDWPLPGSMERLVPGGAEDEETAGAVTAVAKVLLDRRYV
ncbi:uncharacterized protein DSM5745_09472 [Aspergillus mulundensis]|uniref:Uncharacterized protein n=1 Tax=Aspergillus mulundensis TaxID=1810919 RepID=A0A3D8QV43_9EURO|nr:Uncharacterized protein DSM5745_09472 [Aspergillus mulundensis]RDW65733.1 Uncharacterized protein DSM5745_09472 [Aspergillus mulundensis]